MTDAERTLLFAVASALLIPTSGIDERDRAEVRRVLGDAVNEIAGNGQTAEWSADATRGAR